MNKENNLTSSDKELLELSYQSLVLIRNIARSNSDGKGLDFQQTKAILELSDACHELPKMIGDIHNPMRKAFIDKTKFAIALYSSINRAEQKPINTSIKDLYLIIAAFIVSMILGIILQLKIASTWEVWHIVVFWIFWLTISFGTCVSLVFNSRK
ncbi:hypothetical protein ABBZ21_19795 [Acinetobacter baumannii]|uniref:hypothetical protein n=1 Tax=Acinetobacter baumannii TaxID=470 RepID=UPI0038591DD0